jgi:nicotinamidase-related amidase
MCAPEADVLIVVDVQHGFVAGPDAIPAAAGVLVAVDRLLQRARDAGSLIVHVQNDGPCGAVDEPGTPGWVLETNPLPTETVIRKQGDDAFAGTGLETLLRDYSAAVAVICGLQSEMCVAATARTAMKSDLVVVLPRDAHHTYAVPADNDGGIAVPAPQVARVAEWSLGDALVVPRSSTEIAFVRTLRSR